MIDVAVAGGGPAGLATALTAARAGLRVVVFEPRPGPIDKACGEGLMPGALAALRRLGVDPPGMPLRGITYCSTSGRSVSTDFRDGPGRGVRRTVLQEQLHRACTEAGVEIRPERARDVTRHDDHVAVDGVRARYLVAADGLHSGLRALVDPRSRAAATTARRWGIRAHFAVPPWTDRVEVHWARRAEAYVTPVGPDCVGVALLGGERASFADRLRPFEQLRLRLPAAPVGPAMAAGPLRQDVGRRVDGRVLLVGDAAGYLDALTGEGLAIAFRCAEAAVRRIGENDVAAYEHDYARISRRYRLLTGALLSAAAHPVPRRAIVPVACSAPVLFRAAVSALSG